MPAWMTSLLRELVPVPIALSRSSTITSRPASAKARAIARPTTPAPITTVSIFSTDTMRPILNEGPCGRVRYFEQDDGESAETRAATRRRLAGDRARRSRRGGGDRKGPAAAGPPGRPRGPRAQPSRGLPDAAIASRRGARRALPGARARARLGGDAAQPRERPHAPRPQRGGDHASRAGGGARPAHAAGPQQPGARLPRRGTPRGSARELPEGPRERPGRHRRFGAHRDHPP